MNRKQLAILFKRYFDSGFRINKNLFRYLQREGVIGSSEFDDKRKQPPIVKFWNPRLNIFEIKVYVEGREDKRSSDGIVGPVTCKKQKISEE